MKRVLDFLSELRVNNNREWFNANKGRYSEANAVFSVFAENLIAAIGQFDPAVRGLALRDCTYRIYRDTRFSPDKTPYKTHKGVYVCPAGKKSGNAGYYFHVEPEGDGLIGGHVFDAGIYMPEPAVLKSVRDEIFDNGEAISAAVCKAHGFELDRSNALKRTPKGYPSDTPYDEYLRLKDFHLSKSINDDYLLADGLVERVAADFRTTYELVSLLNRATKYAHEER
jgi:uncharacterized protein (TIGR02453 family)